LLGRVVSGYEGDRIYGQRQHTVRTVMALLRPDRISSPIEGGDAIERASDVFCGYLMLDALIGNTDRHHQNWGLILSPRRQVGLAPTFDHASSLGRNETDESRKQRLVTKDIPRSVAAYASRSRSAFYRHPADSQALLTMDAFYDAANLRSRSAKYWIRKLSGVESRDIENILDQFPSSIMSNIAKQFAFEMLRVNKENILAQQSVLS
jgi:hypothetical protein